MTNVLNKNGATLDVVQEASDVYRPTSKPTPQKWLKCPQRENDIRQLCEANGVKHFLYGAPHLVLYVLAIYLQLTVDSLWANIFLAFVLGNSMFVMTVLYHDCMHGTAFKNDLFNRLMGRIYACTFTMTFTVSRQTHMRHHAHIADPERDPDEYFFSGSTASIWFRACRYLELYTYIALTRYGKKVRYQVIAEQLFIIALWGGVHYYLISEDMGMKLVWLFWLPIGILALVINPMVRGYEHSPITLYAKDDPRRVDMSKNSITVANSVLGWCWANINYHAEHHAYIRVPFYNMQKLHKIFQEEKMQYLMAPYPLYRIFKGKKMLDGMTCNSSTTESTVEKPANA